MKQNQPQRNNPTNIITIQSSFQKYKTKYFKFNFSQKQRSGTQQHLHNPNGINNLIKQQTEYKHPVLSTSNSLRSSVPTNILSQNTTPQQVSTSPSIVHQTYTVDCSKILVLLLIVKLLVNIIVEIHVLQHNHFICLYR